MALLDQLCFYVLLFFTVSVLGWCMEVILKYIQYHRFINRGFLLGPYCPIYGSGALFITLFVGAFSKIENSVGSTFVISLVVCGIWEYAVSYYLEKRFHARWWDYSKKPMNLNGRIWIGNLLLFGIGGTVIIKVLNPILFHMFSYLSKTALHVCASLIVIGMSSDYLTSHFVMQFVKSCVDNSEADDTESIRNEIKVLLNNKSILYRRIANAYPDVVYRTEKIAKKMQKIHDEMELMKKEATEKVENAQQRLEDRRESIAMKLQPSSQIKDTIIEKQDALIQLLETEDRNAEKINQLKTEVAQSKKLLTERNRKSEIL